jgi:hypothetical protein
VVTGWKERERKREREIPEGDDNLCVSQASSVDTELSYVVSPVERCWSAASEYEPVGDCALGDVRVYPYISVADQRDSVRHADHAVRDTAPRECLQAWKHDVANAAHPCGRAAATRL